MVTKKRNNSSLLYPKITPPASSRPLVQRKSLTEWIQSAEHVKLVSICAPAGFGKTTLMVQWIGHLRERNLPAAWLTLDNADNDPRRFLFNLFASLQEHVPDFAPDALEDDIFDNMHSAGEILPFLLDSLSRFEQPLTIFLDDVCSIKSPQVLDAIKQILSYLSPGKRLVAAMRLPPDLGLSKLRAKNALVEIGLEDLRLTFEETKQFVCQSQHLDFDQKEVEHLHNLTEGWVTGLQLSTLSDTWQRQHSETHQPIRAFRLISDYLVEDVLANQPQDVLSFLLQTSILNSLTGPLCDAVTGGTGGYEMLDYLEKNNLFVISLDEERNWYRYHSLFAKFLRSRLERRGGPDKLIALHRAAFEWYSQAGEMLEAAHHAMLTGDVELAAEYMERCALDLVMTGQSSTVFEWGRRLPAEVLDRHHELQFAYVYALTYQQQFSAAIEAIGRIRRLLKESGEDFKYIHHLETAEAYAMLCLDRFSEFERGIAEGIEGIPKLKPNDRTGHLPMLFHGAVVTELTSGNFQNALTRVWQAAKFLNKKTQLQVIYNTYFEECIYLAQGRLNETLGLARATLSKTENSPNRFSVSAAAVAVLEAEALYERNELSKAESLLNKYRSVLSDCTFPDILIVGFRTLARVCFAQGDRDQASDYITELGRCGVARGVPRMSAAAWLENIHMKLQCDSLEHAVRSFDDHIGGPLGLSLGGRHCMLGNEVETLDVTRLRLLIAEHKFNADLLKNELKNAGAIVFLRRKLLLLVLIAKAHYLGGDKKQALRILKDALLSAQAEGFIRTFVDEGEPLPHMIRDVYKVVLAEESKGDRKLSSDYLLRILGAMGTSAPVCDEVKQPQDLSLLEELTEREKSILEKLALGYSTEELASSLYISVHTVRYHLRNIYSKLGANSRVQAVALARQLDLIR